MPAHVKIFFYIILAQHNPAAALPWLGNPRPSAPLPAGGKAAPTPRRSGIFRLTCGGHVLPGSLSVIKMAPSRANGLSKSQANLLNAVCACNYKHSPLTRSHKLSFFVSRFTPSRHFY